MHLPIDDIRDDFESALARTSRLVVTAETGAGKSTRIPVWLTDHTDELVLVVEPRRVACHALADFLSSQRGERTGGFFGSRVRFSDRSSKQTRALFCTPGVALRMLADPDATFGGIVVDEFHERSWQMDLVVAAAASQPRFADTPLIITSATIDAEEAAAVLGAETLHATGRTFPVDISYDDSSTEPSDRDLGDRAAKAVKRALRGHDGDVLVFLPGMKEIRATESALGRRDEEVLIVHGSRPPEAMRHAFSESDRRRVYLSTNVAETSITLPGVRVVIDSGLHKTRLHRAGRAALATVPISQASMDQRAGRAGRVAQGACIRLWSERYRPSEYRTPEIARTELDDLLLQAAELGFDGEDFDRATWVTPPPEFAVERARKRLRALGALDNDRLTDDGHRLSRLPVAAEEAALLVGAPPAIDGTLCDLVALLQSRGPLMRNLGDLSQRKQGHVKNARADLLAGVTDEVTMNLKLLREGDAHLHHLSDRRMSEAKKISRQLRDLIGATGESTDGLAAFILKRLPEAGFVLRPRAQKKGRRSRSQPWANGEIEVSVYPFEPFDPETDPAKPTTAVILETEWLGSGPGVFGIGRNLLPARASNFVDAGIGESEIADVKLKKSRGRVRITAQKEVRLAGVALASGESKLRGEDLRRAVARFVMEGRLFKGAADEIRQGLHGWSILANWPVEQDLGGYERPDPPSPDAPEPWLVERFDALGLQTAEELQLLENADIVPDLADVTGLPAWLYQPIVDDFPRTWTHQGSTYSCSVDAGAEKVVLEPANGKAKKVGEPPAKLLPRFRDFKVVYRQASRMLRLR